MDDFSFRYGYGPSAAYDPSTDSYSSPGSGFITLAGTPAIAGGSTVAGRTVGGRLVLNAAEIISAQSVRYGTLDFFLKVPTAPTSGHVRAWGIKVPGMANVGGSMANAGRIEFDVTGADFSAKVWDAYGALVGSQAIAWKAEWTNVMTCFTVAVKPSGAYFSVNGAVVASFQSTDASPISTRPAKLHVLNSVADALESALISTSDVASFS